MKIAKFVFSLFGVTTYVVWDPDTLDCAIIDPGMINSEEEEALKNFIEKNNLKVDNIINTHLHLDHAVGNAYAHDLFKVPVQAHKEDESLGSRLQEQARMFGIYERIRETSIDSYLEEGDIIKIGNGELKVLHVPGHSPGSIALYDAKDGFVIVGDALFEGSVGRTDLTGGNGPQLIKSIKDKLLTLPDETIVYSGHGNPTSIGRERKSNPFLRPNPNFYLK